MITFGEWQSIGIVAMSMVLRGSIFRRSIESRSIRRRPIDYSVSDICSATFDQLDKLLK